MRFVFLALLSACFIAPDRPKQTGDGGTVDAPPCGSNALTASTVLNVAIAVPNGGTDVLVRAGMDGTDAVVMAFGGVNSRCPTSTVKLRAPALSAIHALSNGNGDGFVYVLGENAVSKKLEVRVVTIGGGAVVEDPSSLKSFIEPLPVPVDQQTGTGYEEHPAFVTVVNTTTPSQYVVFGGGNTLAFGVPAMSAPTAATAMFAAGSAATDQTPLYRVARLMNPVANRTFIMMSPDDSYIGAFGSGDRIESDGRAGGSCEVMPLSTCRGRVTHEALNVYAQITSSRISAYGITRKASSGTSVYFEAILDSATNPPGIAVAKLESQGFTVLDVAIDELAFFGVTSARDVMVLYDTGFDTQLLWYFDSVDGNNDLSGKLAQRTSGPFAQSIDQVVIGQFATGLRRVLLLSNRPGVFAEYCFVIDPSDKIIMPCP